MPRLYSQSGDGEGQQKSYFIIDKKSFSNG